MIRLTCLVALSMLILVLGQSPAYAATAPGVFDVRASGAKGDGKTLDTAALQGAIDACNGAGGGTVLVSAGHYLTGTLTLKDGVTLRLAKGATLLGSTDLKDYPPRKASYRSYTDHYTDRALIYAENAHDVAITGEGTIDGQGGSFHGHHKKRPYLVRFATCDGVTLDGVTLRDGAMWTVHFLACDHVYVHGVTVRSRCNGNNDGFDIDSSADVRVSDCDVSTGDDAIVFKSTSARPCRDIVVSNCILSSACNALKTGTESNGGFQNIAISNCVLHDVNLAGIALEIVDGGLLDGVTISNITMRNVTTPIFIRLGDRGRRYKRGTPRPGVGALRNVSISHVMATGAKNVGCSITGLPGHPVENIALTDIRLQFAGGGTAEDAKRVPKELPGDYPEEDMFGILPSYGFYVRHAKNVRFRDVAVSTKTPDARPALAHEDVESFTTDGFSPAP